MTELESDPAAQIGEAAAPEPVPLLAPADGLPTLSSAARTASRAAGKRGAVAFQSRYVRSAFVILHRCTLDTMCIFLEISVGLVL